MNFFDPANFAAVVDFVNSVVNDQFGTYAYVKTFTSINWTEPDRVADTGDWITWTKAVLGMYGLLVECGIWARHSLRVGLSSAGPTLCTKH